jgi:DNA-binding NarL/FixJ family response regulator
MINVLLIGGKNGTLSELSGLLNSYDDVAISEIESGENADEITSRNEHQLVIVDYTVGNESGIEFTKKLIGANPLLNCAVVSTLSGKDFHEATEGLGVLAKISKNPASDDVANLLDNLRRILGLLR